MKTTENKKTKIKFKKANIFVAINILFLIGCCIFYGYRLVHYYKEEHPKIKEDEDLVNIVTMNKNIVTTGSGLYKAKDMYIYKGRNLSNYVLFSGRIWRIVSIDNESNIKLITDQSQTSLVWGVSANYENSYVRSWLNDDNNKIKSFYSSITDTSNLLTTKTCKDTITENKVTCNDMIEDKVGLLSAYEYQQAGGKDSYLNINQYWWTSNINSEKTAWYVYSKGSLNDTSYSGKTHYIYGVRPTITIKGSINIKGGDGSLDNPYNLDSNTESILNKKYVGSYLNYSGYRWRIIETDTSYVKVVMDETVKESKKDYYTNFGTSNYYAATSKVGKYLNNVFYNDLSNKDYVLEHNFYAGRYDSTNKYDFNELTEYNEKAKVGLLQLGELFVTDVQKYFLASRTKTTENNIYEVLEEGRIYAGDVSDELRLRPTLYLNPNIAVSSGTGGCYN
jgi:hypothetical protein